MPTAQNSRTVIKMAIVRVPISFDYEGDHLFNKASAAGLGVKQSNELVAGWSALKAWKKDLEGKYGLLREIVSLSNPDDPPDLIFEFESKSLTVELTDLKPHPYGQAQAIHREEMPNAFVLLPAVSIPNQKKSEIRQAMISKIGMQWEAVGDRQRYLLAATIEQIARKTRSLNAANVDVDIVVLNDSSLFFGSDIIPLVRGIARLLRERALQIPAALLVHSQSNILQFRSFIIDARGQIITPSKEHD